MTEYELLDLMGNTIDSMGDCFTIYLSIISGYLVVAYFIGTGMDSSSPYRFGVNAPEW